jgi:7-carboxy-7-deazaguanine synthase
MRCVWCDSEYTFIGGEHVSLEDVMKQVRAFGCRLVEITGGEPLAQPEARTLIRQLCDEGFEVLIETGGYFSTKGIDDRAALILDVKCPASGEEERNHWPNLERLRAERDEVKFVITNREDWDYAVNVVRRFDLESAARAVLISPAWGEIELKDLAEWVAGSGLKVRMQIQLHKYIWGPEVHGV